MHSRPSSSPDSAIPGHRPVSTVTVSTSPSITFSTEVEIMSQDAEDGPEMTHTVSEPILHSDVKFRKNARPPMDQTQFDQTYSYQRPAHHHGTLARHMGKAFRQYYQPCTSPSSFLQSILSFLPILRWLPNYGWRENLLSDVIGGCTVAVMHVPQGLAYAVLAGVEPVIGLYTSFFPPLFYMVFGTSRHCSIGSFAVVALMAGMAVEQMSSVTDVAGVGVRVDGNSTATTTESASAMEDPSTRSSSDTISSTLALTVGLVQLVLALLHLDILTTYLSEQVVAGFTTAASCHVFTAQLKDFFGLSGLPKRWGAGNMFLRLYDICRAMPHANPPTMCLGLCCILLLVLGKELINPWMKRRLHLQIPLPFELIIMVMATAFAYAFDLHERYQIKIVEEIPIGVPRPSMPDFALIPRLLPDAIGIAVVVIAVHISLAKMFAKKLDYKVDAGQELYALSLSSSLSSIFPVYPVSCSLGRTLVNVEAGTKTQFSTIFSSILLAGIILYMGEWLRTLPMCALSAIIIVSLKGMIKKFKDLRTLFPLSKIDFSIWAVSFVATVAWDVTEGLGVAICYALFTTVLRTQFPRWHYLAHLVGTNDFRDAERYHEVINHTGICIFRFDAPLIFTNVDRFKTNVHEAFIKWQQERPFVLTAQDLDGPLSDGSNKAKISQVSVAHLNNMIACQQDHSYIPYEKATSGLLYRHFIIDCSGFTFVDYMGVNALKEIFSEMSKEKVLCYFAAAKAPVRDLFKNSGFYSCVPAINFYPTIRDAVAIAKKRRTESTLHLLEELSIPYDSLDGVIDSQPMD